MANLSEMPRGMTGWFQELEHAETLLGANEGELRVKIVATENGVFAFAAGGQPGEARKLLEALGFTDDQIRRLLCG